MCQKNQTTHQLISFPARTYNNNSTIPNSSEEECDKLSVNKDITKIISLEHSMIEENYDYLVGEYGETKLILAFPTHPANQEMIIQEVKSILASTLNEYFKEIS